MSVQTQELVRTNWKTRLEKCEDWEVMRLRRHTLIRRDEKLMLVSGSENLFPWFSRWRRARKADERKSVAALVFLSFGGMEGTTPPPPPTSAEEEESSLGGSPPPRKGSREGSNLAWGMFHGCPLLAADIFNFHYRIIIGKGQCYLFAHRPLLCGWMTVCGLGDVFSHQIVYSISSAVWGPWWSCFSQLPLDKMMKWKCSL